MTSADHPGHGEWHTMAASLVPRLTLMALMGLGGTICPLITPAAFAASPARPAHPEAAAGALAEEAMDSFRAAPLPVQVKPEIKVLVQKLARSTRVQEALAQIRADQARYVQEAIQISEIPAPTFAEARRAQAYATLLKANGLSDVRIDAVGNVIGVRKGTGAGPQIALSLIHI